MKRSSAVVLSVTLLLMANTAQADNACHLQSQRIVNELLLIRAERQVPAMGLGIFCDGQPLIIAGYGNASADTPFRWGSITKSLTGLAALKLIESTHVDVDTAIRPILGEGYFTNPWAASHPVRLGQLLALSAGLPDLTPAEWNDNEPQPLWQALQRHQDARILLWPAGLQHSYSNVPPGFTAAIIERVSGLLFQSYLEEKLFQPLGMDEATLARTPGLPGGYQADGRTEIPYWHMTFPAFGALNASTREMSRLMTALLNEGRLEGGQPLSQELVAEFFRPRATAGTDAGLQVAYGAGVYGWVRGGRLFHGHGGDADGYRSRYGLMLEQGRGYLLVINQDDPRTLGSMVRLVEEALIDDLPAPTSLSPVPVTGAQLDALSGDYYPANARFDPGDWQSGNRATVPVRRSGQTLLVERSGRTIRLYPAGGGRFFRKNDPAVTAVFVRDDAGSLHLQGELGNFVRISPGPCPDFLPFCD